jgi:hypothetical protein
MASRSHTTFQKRQKELARLEKQREKFEKRKQRKLEKLSPEAGGAKTGDVVDAEPGLETLPDFEGGEVPPPSS